MSNLKFITDDVNEQMKAAREVLVATREIDQILTAGTIPDSDKEKLRQIRRRLAGSVDDLIKNVENVQEIVIRTVRTTSGL